MTGCDIRDKFGRILWETILAYFVVLICHILPGVTWIVKYLSQLPATRTKFDTVGTRTQIIRITIQGSRQVEINYYFKK
jgi:hypothetical protein